MTITYALQGFDIPSRIDRIYHGHWRRAAPGPNFLGPDGPVDDFEQGKWPPDVWFNSMHILARIPSPAFDEAVARIPSSLTQCDDLFAVADDGKTVTIQEAQRLADLWLTVFRGGFRTERIGVQTAGDLESLRSYICDRRSVAEDALSRLKRCLADERRLLVSKKTVSG